MTIKLTKNAINAIKKELKENIKDTFIRISVKGGGCSGFNFNIIKEKNKNQTDLIIENIEEIILISDIFSIIFLKNAIIDYVPNYDFENSFIFNTNFNKTKCSGCK